jgi:hypothetical protein
MFAVVFLKDHMLIRRCRLVKSTLFSSNPICIVPFFLFLNFNCATIRLLTSSELKLPAAPQGGIFAALQQTYGKRVRC